MLTQAILKDIFSYDYNTGQLLWKPRKYLNPKTIGQPAGCLVFSKKTNYTRHNIGLFRKIYTASRLVWLYHKGSWPNNFIDHINGNSIDNRIENLRDVTNQENCKNAKQKSNNTSGITGVRWDKQRNHFITTLSSKVLYRGKNLFEACCVRKTAELTHKYHINHGRIHSA